MQNEEIKKPTAEKVSAEDKNAVLESMMFSPSASDADATITAKEDKPKADELLKVLESGKGELSEEYKKELLSKALKDPMSVEVKTPKGWMTVKEAIAQGFNLKTGKFDGKSIPEIDWKGEIDKLDPREKATIESLTKPGARQAGPRNPNTPVNEEGLPMEEGTAPTESAPADNEGGTALPLGGV